VGTRGMHSMVSGRPLAGSRIGRAQRHGHDVRVVAATLVRSLGVGQRGLKNDVRDARTLSEASCRIELPSVHIPSAISQDDRYVLDAQIPGPKVRTVDVI
jgi:hypothetical protein